MNSTNSYVLKGMSMGYKPAFPHPPEPSSWHDEADHYLVSRSWISLRSLRAGVMDHDEWWWPLTFDAIHPVSIEFDGYGFVLWMEPSDERVRDSLTTLRKRVWTFDELLEELPIMEGWQEGGWRDPQHPIQVEQEPSMLVSGASDSLPHPDPNQE